MIRAALLLVTLVVLAWTAGAGEARWILKCTSIRCVAHVPTAEVLREPPTFEYPLINLDRYRHERTAKDLCDWARGETTGWWTGVARLTICL